MSNVPKLRFKEFSGEWEEKLFKNIVDIVGGGTPDTTKEEYWNGNIQWFTPTEIKSKYISNSKRTITELGLKKSSAKILPIGTLLLSTRATIGDVGIAVNECTTNQGFQSLITKDNSNNEFLYNWITTNKKEFLRKASGSTFLEISKKEIEKISISIPSKPEQERIASFLTSVDIKIEQLTKKEQLLQQYKKSVMQKIFNQEIRFRADDGSEFCDWEEKKVSDIFDVTRGYVLAVTNMSEVKTDEFKYPVYSSQTKNKGLTGYYNQYLYENSITWTTDGANAGDVNFRQGKFYCTNVCGVLKSDKGYANECIAQILNSVTKKYVSYVGNPKLMNNTMGSIKIFVPSSIEEQTKIANFLLSIDSKIEQVQKQLNSTKEFKKALLQQMFV